MRMRSARNQERGCVFLRLLSPTRKTPASIFRRLPRWCNPCESCPMNHWQWDPRSSLRMRLRILLEESFVFACCLLPTPCAKMPFCLSAPAHGWKQPKRNPVPPTLRVLTKIPLRSTDTTLKIAVPIPGSQFISCHTAWTEPTASQFVCGTRSIPLNLLCSCKSVVPNYHFTF